ncbi:MAG: bifunctional diaminohydroxyphosphoribosylaminopyrimidine deaminase/5-amino-6-(5-phosphoribosylamino)uracil reductase RibD [Actinobacteria bacterium]|nr:MAG: bifunctional diaminohydroxyphosphoribosylaminopyrimidine deaminase/5-amino-6-(5-phosphoribosylamino)uracil reductase RibD [Actinomycetota bacterium]
MRMFSDASCDVVDPWLRRAYTLAERGRGATSPNPVVGCVLVRDEGAVGEGWHARCGGPHAEVAALAAAGERARGATAYVTLEPCNHTGATPPCTEALIAAGVATVVVGMPDPNPDVTGGGAARLREAGIEVRFASDPKPFERQNEAWIRHVTCGMPWVRVKTALTLDGHASLAPGVRARLTGPEAQRLTMRLRAAADAVLVSAATVDADDPLLTVRDADGASAARQPLRVALSRTIPPAPGARMFAQEGASLVLMGDTAHADALAPLRDAGIHVETYVADGGITAALGVLGARGVTSVLVEAGPGLLTALVGEGLADEVVIYHAGGFAGDVAPAVFLGPASVRCGEFASAFVAVEAGVVGRDAVTVWRPAAAGAQSAPHAAG